MDVAVRNLHFRVFQFIPRGRYCRCQGGAAYATRSQKPKPKPQAQTLKSNQNPKQAQSTPSLAQKSGPASNNFPSIPGQRPEPLTYGDSRLASKSKPVWSEAEIGRLSVRQKLGYDSVARKILQLMVGLPVVIVFGYHLYGRMFLGWEQKQPDYKTLEDGTHVENKIPWVTDFKKS